MLSSLRSFESLSCMWRLLIISFCIRDENVHEALRQERVQEPGRQEERRQGDEGKGEGRNFAVNFDYSSALMRLVDLPSQEKWLADACRPARASV